MNPGRAKSRLLRAGFTHSPGGYHRWVEWITELMSALGAMGVGLGAVPMVRSARTIN